MLALRIITTVAMAIALMGAIAGSEKDKRTCITIFTVAGCLMLLSLAVERMS